jgi:hypothetical protein
MTLKRNDKLEEQKKQFCFLTMYGTMYMDVHTVHNMNDSEEKRQIRGAEKTVLLFDNVWYNVHECTNCSGEMTCDIET